MSACSPAAASAVVKDLKVCILGWITVGLPVIGALRPPAVLHVLQP